MEKEDIKNLIDENVRKSTDSAIKALTNLIGSIQQDTIKHRVDEALFRERFKEEMAVVVQKQIQITVNGKIDNLKHSQETFHKEMNDFMKKIEPVEHKFSHDKSVEELRKEDTKRLLKWTGVIAALGGAVYIIKQFAIWFLQ